MNNEMFDAWPKLYVGAEKNLPSDVSNKLSLDKPQSRNLGKGGVKHAILKG